MVSQIWGDQTGGYEQTPYRIKAQADFDLLTEDFSDYELKLMGETNPLKIADVRDAFGQEESGENRKGSTKKLYVRNMVNAVSRMTSRQRKGSGDDFTKTETSSLNRWKSYLSPDDQKSFMGEINKLRTPGVAMDKTFESIDKIEEIFGRNITMDKWHGKGYSQDNKIMDSMKKDGEWKVMNQDYKAGK